MATTKVQRVGIWIIAVFMAIGTVGSFAIIVLANQNSQNDQKKLQDLSTQYQKDYDAYQEKVDAQAKALSDAYFSKFSSYTSRATAFDKASVTELKTEDLVVGGEGEPLTESSSFTAYYIGWNPEGKIFDSSIESEKESLKAPYTVAPGEVIQGWTKGAVGMKVGGVREITIPSDLAYGESGSGELIPASTPLKFVIMVIPTPEEIVAPTMPQELLNYYQTGRLQ